MLRAGTLDRRVTFQKRERTRDSWGEMSEAWVDHVANLPADWRAPTGMGQISGEMQAGGTEVSRVPYSVRIRFRRDITADMRAVDEFGTVYEIRQVIPEMKRREWTDVVLATGANDG